MFSYESFVHNGANIELTYKFNSDYLTIISTPMFHVLGFNDTVLPTLMAGGTLVLQRYFNGEELNNMIAQYHPDFLIMIPTMYYSTLTQDNFNPEHFRAMKYVIQGGSQPLPSIQQAFKSTASTSLTVMVSLKHRSCWLTRQKMPDKTYEHRKSSDVCRCESVR